MGDVARGQAAQQGVVVDQGAATGVQDHGARWQEAKGFGVQDILGFGRSRQQGDNDAGTAQGGAQVGRGGDAGHGFLRAAPPRHRKMQGGKGVGAGGAKGAHAEQRDRSFPGQRRAGRVPDVARVDDMAVHPEMVAQRMAHDPFDHALGQAAVDHAAQRLGQGCVAHDPLDPGPQAEHGLAAGEGGKVLQRGRGGIDDVIDRRRIGCLGHHVAGNPGLDQQRWQDVAVFGPKGGGGEVDQGHVGPDLVVGKGLLFKPKAAFIAGRDCELPALPAEGGFHRGWWLRIACSSSRRRLSSRAVVANCLLFKPKAAFIAGGGCELPALPAEGGFHRRRGGREESPSLGLMNAP